MRLIVHTATPIRSKYGSELVKEANTLFLEEKKTVMEWKLIPLIQVLHISVILMINLWNLGP